MSEWYEAKDEDIEVKERLVADGEVYIYVKQNDFGAVYVTLTYKQIDDIHQKIHAAKQE